jgi:Protein of unknown function (DUF3300)/Chaperone of endosialidase
VALSVMRSIALAIAIATPVPAMAQTSSPASHDGQLLKSAELDQLVAPIALYPDNLLSEVLIASVYPLDIVQAERWLQANTSLKGDQLKAAVNKQPWDDSVKSLVATPSVLEMMSTKLDWTQKLGDAVVAQQADVMDAIQRLRSKAQANNKLTSTQEQTVTVGQAQGRQVIAIESTTPGTVYVPYYDPGVVYGGWPYPEYPPYYFPPPGYIAAGVIATGIAFGAGYALGRWWSGGNYWGGGINWSGGGNNIVVNPAGNRGRPSNPIANGGNRWQPRADHRQGAGNRGNRAQQRDFRGNRGQQVLKPGGGRGNLGQGNRPSNRPSVGGGSNRPSVGGGRNRPSAGGGRNRPSAGTRPSRGAHAANRPARGGGRAHVSGGGGQHRGGGNASRARGGGGGGGMRARGGGGGGFRGGGGRGGGRGGRRSDIRLKHDIVLLGHLDNGLGFYRFSYNGSDKAYVGVVAQEVQKVVPTAVARGEDGYLKVYYDKLGLTFETYDRWIQSGAHVPTGSRH